MKAHVYVWSRFSILKPYTECRRSSGFGFFAPLGLKKAHQIRSYQKQPLALSQLAKV